MQSIETRNFVLRPFILDDVDGLFELDSNPNVHKYLGNKPVKTKQECIEIIQFIQKQYQENGIGRFAIIDKQTNEFLGWSGLKYVREEINGLINFHDLGYRLIERFWNKGIATECAEAWTNYAFENLKLPEIYAMADIENSGSNRVLQKLNFVIQNKFEYDGSLHHFYKLSNKK